MGRRKEFNEKDVLEKALYIFWINGYEKTSMDDLTKAMGIQRKSLYNTFNDKKNLYYLALEMYKKQMKNTFNEVLTSKKNARKKLEEIFDIVLEQGEKGCFMLNTAIEMSHSDEKLKLASNHVFRSISEVFHTIIIEGQTNEEISKEKNADAFATILLNTWLACRVLLKTGQHDESINKSIQETIDLLY